MIIQPSNGLNPSLKMLRVATFSNYYYLKTCALYNLTPRPFCDRPGVAAEIFLLLLNRIGAPYELVAFPDNITFGELHGNRWRNGLFELLQNGSIDLIANFWMENEARRNTFVFSYPVSDSHLSFVSLAGRPDMSSSAQILFHVYGFWIWLFIIFGIGLVNLIRNLFGKKTRCSSFAGCKVFLAVMGWSSVLFMNLYKGALLSQLLNPGTHLHIESLWHMIDMIQNNDLKMIIDYEDDHRMHMIDNYPGEFFDKLRNVLKKHPIQIERNPGILAEKVLSGKYVYPSNVEDIQSIKMTSSCHIDNVLEPPIMPATQLKLMLAKNSIWIEPVNLALIQLQEKTQDVVQRYTAQMDKAVEAKCLSTDRRTPLTLLALSGAFYWFMACCMGTMGALCLELFQNRFCSFEGLPWAKRAKCSKFAEVSCQTDFVCSCVHEGEKIIAEICWKCEEMCNKK